MVNNLFLFVITFFVPVLLPAEARTLSVLFWSFYFLLYNLRYGLQNGAHHDTIHVVLEERLDGIALVAGVDRIFDMGRTTLNITGDASCSVIVSNILRKKGVTK